MNEYILKIEKAIDEVVQDFLGCVGQLCEPRFNRAPFPLLMPENSEFYKISDLETSLEYLIRDYLINAAFQKFFEIHNINNKWPQTPVVRTTEHIENISDFEFIFEYRSKNIGVRYTGLCPGEARELIRKHKITEIIQIRWNDQLTLLDERQKEYEVVTPRTFFLRYLSSDAYELFIGKAVDAVAKANKEIGYDAVHMFTPRNINSFKLDLDMTLRNMNFEDMSEAEFSKDDHAIMRNNFQTGGLYKSLFGMSDFATCFITAEYLYQLFKQGYAQCFDYTSVACGYFKAVEELIYMMLTINLAYPSADELWIKKNSITVPKTKQDIVVLRKNPVTNADQVRFINDSKEYFDTTLSPMIWFLHDNPNGWMISDAGRRTAHEFLINFARDHRNNRFHKDNIEDFNDIKIIRDKTLLIFYILLGGYRLSGDSQKDLSLLGAVDNSFDRLYKEIASMPAKKFVLYYRGEEPIKAYRCLKVDSTNYDSNGFVSTGIRFVKATRFNSDEYQKAMNGLYPEREFMINNTNMPEKISYINSLGEEIFINY